MARPGRPEGNRAARSFRQLKRFHHVINSDKVFGTHNDTRAGRSLPDRPHRTQGRGVPAHRRTHRPREQDCSRRPNHQGIPATASSAGDPPLEQNPSSSPRDWASEIIARWGFHTAWTHRRTERHRIVDPACSSVGWTGASAGCAIGNSEFTWPTLDVGLQCSVYLRSRTTA